MSHPAPGTWRATSHGEAYAVAAGCGHSMKLYYRTMSDPSDVYTTACKIPSTATVAVTVDLAGVAAGELGTVWVNNLMTAGAGGAMVIQAQPGPSDVLAYVTPSQGAAVPTLLYRGATIDVEQPSTLQIDLAGMARPPEAHPLTIAGAEAGAQITVTSAYSTQRADWPLVSQPFTAGAAASYATLDASQRQPGELTSASADVQRVAGWTADLALHPADSVSWAIFRDASSTPPDPMFTAGVVTPHDGELTSQTSVTSSSL